MSATPQRASQDGEQGVNAAKGGRIFDNASQSWMVKVFPGEFHVTSRADETLVTILGSCVAA